MKVEAFEFDLPQERIALEPARPADSARMLVVPPEGKFADARVGDLPDWLRDGDLVVFNDTRVIPAQLEGVRRRDGASGAKVGFTLHRRTAPDRWLAIARGAKKLRKGDDVSFERDGSVLKVSVGEKNEAGMFELTFDREGDDLDASIGIVGTVPLPPYITAQRGVGERDVADYQTMFAARDGAVAAPTAGLHFTPALRARLGEKGVRLAGVTLHVGAGTFLPVKAEDTREHCMHAEWGEVSAKTASIIQETREAGGRIVALGTTSLRLIETAGRSGSVQPWVGETDIFITPGFEFRIADVLMTNFHLPRSTLFMLVSAFSGLERMKAAYDHAIAERYRFYSYGDATLLFRDETKP